MWLAKKEIQFVRAFFGVVSQLYLSMFLSSEKLNFQSFDSIFVSCLLATDQSEICS